MNWGQKITYLAETSVQGKQTRFGIKDKDRLEHVSVVGRVGSDRAATLTNMVLQDVERGIGTVVLDASGYFSELLLERFPHDSLNRLIYLDPSDAEFPFSWNSLDDFRSISNDDVFPYLVDALSALYRTSPSPLLEFTAEEMLNRQDATMLLLYELVQDQYRRDQVLPKESPEREEFEQCLKNSAESAELVLQHGRYLAKDSLMRNLLGQSTSKFTFEHVAKGDVVVMDLSRIRVFPTRITPLVRLMTHAARARVHDSTDPFALYFFDTARYLSQYDIEQMLPERRLAFTLSDAAYFEEDTEARARILARSGTVITFSPGHADAPLIERIFFPYVGLEDLTKLDSGECAALLSIDAVRSRPFFARLFPLKERQNVSLQDIHVASRGKYALSRHQVDQLFARRAPLPQGQGKAPGTDPGSFSNAFRSIFAKSAGAGTSTSGPASASAPASVPSPQSPAPQKTEHKADSNGEPQELSEEELRKMLYVKPIYW